MLADRSAKVDARVAVVLGALTIGLYLLKTVGAGLSIDDAHRPYLAAFGHLTGVGVLGTLLAEMRDAGSSTGGFFPLNSLPSVIWVCNPGTALMRTLQLVAIVVNAATLGALVVRVSRSSGLGLLVLACVALSLQLHLGSDAVIGPMLEQQCVVELGLLSFLLAVCYLVTGELRFLAGTVLTAAAAALVDPLGYVVAIGVSLVIATDTSSPARRRLQLIPIGCIAIIGLAAFTTSALHASTQSDAPHMTPVSYILTVSQRLFAAVPTAYRASGSMVSDAVKGSAADTRFDKVPPPGLDGWLAALAIAACIVFGALATENPSAVSGRPLICLGLTCWIFPAALSSANYGDVGRGTYMQAFGIGLLIALALAAFLAKKRQPSGRGTIIASSALLAFLVAYGNVRANAFVIARAEHSDVSRQMLAPAIEAGLFSSIPANATLVPNGFLGFEAGTAGVRDFRFAAYAGFGRTYASGPRSELLVRSSLCRKTAFGCSPRADTYLITASIPPHTEGSLTALRWTGSNGMTLMSDGGSRFSRFRSSSGRAQSIEHDLESTGQSVVLSTVPIGSRSLLTSAKRLCGPVSLRATFEADSATVRWGAGFYEPYPAIAFIASNNLAPRKSNPTYNDWSYAGPSGHLIVTNNDCAPRAFEVTARIYTSVPARLDVRYLRNHYTYTSTQDGVIIHLPISASPRRVDVALETDASTGHDVYTEARYADARSYDIRMLVDKPTAVFNAAR